MSAEQQGEEMEGVEQPQQEEEAAAVEEGAGEAEAEAEAEVVGEADAEAEAEAQPEADPEEGKKFIEAFGLVDMIVANWLNREDLSPEAIQNMAVFYNRTLKGSRWLKYEDYGFTLIQDAFNTEEDKARRAALHDVKEDDRAKGLNPFRDFAWLEHESGFRVPCFDPSKETPALCPVIPDNIQKDIAGRVYIATGPDIREAWGCPSRPVLPAALKKCKASCKVLLAFLLATKDTEWANVTGATIDYVAFLKAELEVFLTDYLKYFNEIRDLGKNKDAGEGLKKKTTKSPAAAAARPKKAAAAAASSEDGSAAEDAESSLPEEEAEEDEMSDIVYDEQAQKQPLMLICHLNRDTTEWLVSHVGAAVHTGDASCKSQWIFAKAPKFKDQAELELIQDPDAADQRSIEDDIKRYFPSASERKKGKPAPVKKVATKAGAAGAAAPASADDMAVVVQHLESVVQSQVAAALRPVSQAVTTVMNNVNTLMNRTETLARRLDENGGISDAKMTVIAGKVVNEMRKDLFSKLDGEREAMHSANATILAAFEKGMSAVLTVNSFVVPKMKQLIDAVEVDMKERKRLSSRPAASADDAATEAQAIKKAKAEAPAVAPAKPAAKPAAPVAAAKPAAPAASVKPAAATTTPAAAKKPAAPAAAAAKPSAPVSKPSTPAPAPVAAAKPKASPLATVAKPAAAAGGATPAVKKALPIPPPKPPVPTAKK